MKKEKLIPLLKDPDAIRDLEFQKYHSRDLQSSIENGPTHAYEWFEDQVIQKKAYVEFKRDRSGKDSTIIKRKNLDTNKEEVVYYTINKTEVARLKGISEGKTIIVDLSEEDTESN